MEESRRKMVRATRITQEERVFGEGLRGSSGGGRGRETVRGYMVIVGKTWTRK